MLEALGAEVREVRAPEQLSGLDGLVIPGGESTTISKGMARDGLDTAVSAHAEAGGPILGSCAGMIVCDAEHLGIGDYSCRRNAFGRQLQSFEQDLAVEGIGSEPLRAVFIRAPWVERHGPGVEVLAELDGHPVALRDGRLLAVAFHPELTDDSRLHALFMAMCTSAAEVRS
jgi:5'-phosphate synthase pdxT subunit